MLTASKVPVSKSDRVRLLDQSNQWSKQPYIQVIYKTVSSRVGNLTACLFAPYSWYVTVKDMHQFIAFNEDKFSSMGKLASLI